MSATRKPKRGDTYVDPDRIGKFAPSDERQTLERQPADTRATNERQPADNRQTLTRRNIRLPDEYWNRLEAIADHDDRTISELVREAIRQYLRGQS